MSKISTFCVFILLVLIISGCKKPTEPPITTSSKPVAIKVNHVWGDVDTPFFLSEDYNHSLTNEDFNFQNCRYYMSNFQLRKPDGSWWSHPDSYFLVRLTNSNVYSFELGQVPLGEYSAVRFLVGVDSLRNVSGAQTGDLAPSNNMFWSWSTGYIMIKLEGNSPQANGGYFSFHVGGFQNANNSNVTRWREIEFDQSLKVNEIGNPKIEFYADVSKTWSQQNLVSVYNSLHAPAEIGHLMADQFSSCFSLKSID